MKHLKKLASLLLATIMVFGLTATALVAAEPPIEPTPTPAPNGTITISDAVVGQTYKIYQILYLESYNATSGAYAYKANSQWKNWLEANATSYFSFDAQGYVTWNNTSGKTDDIAAAEFAKDALDYAKANPGTISAVDTITAIETNVVFQNLNLGYYLVDSTLGTLCSLDTTNPDVEMHEKNAVPTNDKEVEEDSTNNWGRVSDAEIGETVNFRSTVELPAGSENIIFHDTMSNGLTFNPDSIKIVQCTVTLDGNNKPVITEKTGDDALLVLGRDYTVENPGTNHDGSTCTFEVVFTPDYLNSLTNTELPTSTGENITAYTTVRIKYSATINENAVIGGDGNTNTSYLDYGDENDTHHTPGKTTKTYVWSFDVFKYTNTIPENGGDPVQKPLDGAEFILLNSERTKVAKFIDREEGAVTYRQFDGWDTYTADYEATAANKLVSATDGYVHVEGLDSGTYYLRETKAPDGYNMLAEDKQFQIDPNTSDDGNTMTLTMEDVKVENKTGSLLPTTGGIGTTIFYVVGSILLVGAVVLLVVKKRMSVSK